MIPVSVLILLLTTSMILGRDVRSKGTPLLFSTRDDIRWIDSEHPNSNHTILTAHLKSPDPTGFDFDYEESMIYWIDSSQELIRGMKIDGPSKTPINIASESLSPEGLSFDWVTKKIYLTDSDAHRIEVIEADGSNRKILYWSDLDHPKAIAVDPLQGFLFWTDIGSHKIERASMDGDQASRKVLIDKGHDGIDEPNGLAIDFQTSRIYWVDALHRKIESINYDGGEREVISSNLPNPYSISVSREHIYWTDWTSKTLNVCNKLNCKQKKELFKVDGKEAIANVIHVYDSSRQPRRDNPCHQNGGCSNLCLVSSTNPSGYSCQCPTGLIINSDGKTCPSVSENTLYIARGDDIRQVSLDTPDFTPIELPFRKSIKDVLAVEYDILEGRIYWSDVQLKVIRRGFLNGSQVEDIVKGAVKVESIAIDRLARNLYWTDTDMKRIEMSRLDGSFRRTLIVGGLQNPRAIAISPTKGYMFWTDWSDDPVGKIERAALDGSERKVLVNNLRWVNGLAVDHEKDIVYWCDGHSHKMEMISAEGEGRRELIPDLPDGNCYSISILHNWLYWVDSNRRIIERVSKTTGGDRRILIEHLPDLFAIATVSESTVWGSNSCSNNNGNCSQLCYHLPSSISLSQFPLCGCQNGFKLAQDGSSCQVDPNYVPPPPPPKQEEHRKSEKIPKNPCHNFGCSDICEVLPETNMAKCSCNYDRMLTTNGKTCVDPPQCDSTQFRCRSGRTHCVPQHYVCNGKNDCDDRSDESNCQCNLPDIKCRTDNKCLRPTNICDGVNDCVDGYDEICCGTQSFMCNTPSNCVPMEFVCDGINHCPDGADESSASCSRKSLSAIPIDEPSQNHNVAVVGIICLIVFGLFGFFIYFLRFKSRNQLEGRECAPDFIMMPSTGLVAASDRNRNKIPGHVTPTPGYSVRPSDPVYNISSNSSSGVHYPTETMNPPPSPVTDHYDTSNSSQTASRSSGYHRGAIALRSNPKEKKLLNRRGPPPTPCSTDFMDESDAYGYGYQGYYANSQAEVDPYPPPPTPYFSEASTPPSPCTERSYCYPNPPPSPVQ